MADVSDPGYWNNPAWWQPKGGIDYNQSFTGDFGGVVDALPGLSPASAPSPVQPGAKASWASDWNEFFRGLGKGAAGVGLGYAAARGTLPLMAGDLLSSYFEEKTGDSDESQESSLAKALRDLKESGIISFNLNTGNDDSDKLMI